VTSPRPVGAQRRRSAGSRTRAVGGLAAESGAPGVSPGHARVWVLNLSRSVFFPLQLAPWACATAEAAPPPPLLPLHACTLPMPWPKAIWPGSPSRRHGCAAYTGCHVLDLR